MTRLMGLLAMMVVFSQIETPAGVIQTRLWDERSEHGSYLCDPKSGRMLDGCSWYCVGVGPKVTASSQFRGRRKTEYAPGNAHDFNFKTAWVEGKKGYGVGEFLEYTFRLDKDRESFGSGIDGLVIVNGYRKSNSLWKANSRVKKLRMYLDGREFRTILLKDTPNVQTAKFPMVSLRPGKVTVLRFEVVEVFRGSKYEDTAISELLIDGPSGH